MTDPDLVDKYNFLFNNPSYLQLLIKTLKAGLKQGLANEFTFKLYYSSVYRRGISFTDRLLIFLTKIAPLIVI